MIAQTRINAGTAQTRGLARSSKCPESGRLLIIDDDPINRAVLRRPLENKGYTVAEAESGQQALRHVLQHEVDAILLDIMMPKVDGFELCRVLKRHERTAHIPVLMVTSLTERDERLKGIECGANDFLSKPVDVQDLALRVKNAVYSKYLYDQLKAEQQKCEGLLLNMLPRSIAQRIKTNQGDLADQHPAVTVIIADLMGIAELAGPVATEQIVCLLNEIFSAFDVLVEKRGIEKIKTIGGTYLCAAGVPETREDHAQAAAELGLELFGEVAHFNAQYNTSMNLKVVLNSGPLVAGVIGRRKFTYDIWGTTVNDAWRLASSHSQPGVFAGVSTEQLLRNTFKCDLLEGSAVGKRLFRVSGRLEPKN